MVHYTPPTLIDISLILLMVCVTTLDTDLQVLNLVTKYIMPNYLTIATTMTDMDAPISTSPSTT